MGNAVDGGAIARRLGSAGLWVAVLAPILCLAPFVDKAFHVDDTIGLRVAHQIVHNPFDYFGFEMNWYGSEMKAHEFYQNPPGLCYYLAFIGLAFGWGEVPIHLGLLLMAVAVSVGTYALASQLRASNVLAALTAVLTPVFLVSSTNAMTDTSMVAFYVCAMALWVRGIERNETSLLVLSALFMAAAALTKYFGLSTIPLALAYGVASRKGIGGWALALLIPVAAVAAYQGYTYRLYGTDPLLGAAGYAAKHAFSGRELSVPAMAFTGLSFTGGCFLTAFFFAPLLWGRRVLAWGAALAALGACVPLYVKGFVPEVLGAQLELSPLSIFLCGLFAVGGLHVLGLAGHDLWKHRDPESLLLFLWVAGTFAFSAFVNWTVNGRALLPMAPAVGVLVARRLRSAQDGKESAASWKTWWPLLPATLVALWVTLGDYQLANASRTAAREIGRTGDAYEGQVYFQGHWGFQYYMEEEGARPVDFLKTVVYDGDVIVIPSNNTNIRYLPPEFATPLRTIAVPMTARTATINTVLGAGFYSHGYGPLPFVFGRVPAQEFTLYRIGRTKGAQAPARGP